MCFTRLFAWYSLPDTKRNMDLYSELKIFKLTTKHMNISGTGWITFVE